MCRKRTKKILLVYSFASRWIEMCQEMWSQHNINQGSSAGRDTLTINESNLQFIFKVQGNKKKCNLCLIQKNIKTLTLGTHTTLSSSSSLPMMEHSESFGFWGEDVGPFLGVRVFRKTWSACTWDPSPWHSRTCRELPNLLHKNTKRGNMQCCVLAVNPHLQGGFLPWD